MPQFDEFIKKGSVEEELLRQIDSTRIPRHVAVIMDGNGRWAGQRCLPRLAGHRAGVQAVREIVELSARLDLGYLTLYAFSVDNWKRPFTEIDGLMRLLQEYIASELKTLVQNKIRFRAIGRLNGLDISVQEEIRKAEAATAACTGLTFNIALNYGGRSEIVDAVNSIMAEAAASGRAPEPVDEDTFARKLYAPDTPDPDLLIRTSGEMRVSNFLLWQIAYCEIYVTPTLWPDFRARHLLEAILHFQGRERRYGGLSGRPQAEPVGRR